MPGTDQKVQSVLQVRDGDARRHRALVVICAHNEIDSLPHLLEQLERTEVLVVDDGSTDGTGPAAELAGARVLRHNQRLGKSASLAHAIQYALDNAYDAIVEIGADAIPTEGAIERLLEMLEPEDVGGVSVVQIPVGPRNLAYAIDELLWATLAQGKKLQMARYGRSHLGGVLYAFKPACVTAVDTSVNDDEHVGECIRMSGFSTVFTEDSQVFFDASSSIGHILQRRRRMYFGHMMFTKSMAPSMDAAVAAGAFVRSLREKRSRLAAAVPALVLEAAARLSAWRDTRKPGARADYKRWVTTYAKNRSVLVRSRAAR